MVADRKTGSELRQCLRHNNKNKETLQTLEQDGRKWARGPQHNKHIN